MLELTICEPEKWDEVNQVFIPSKKSSIVNLSNLIFKIFAT